MTRTYVQRGLTLLLGLGGVFILQGCARPSRPPGGPQDRIPPMVVATWPDTFEVVEASRDPVVFEFSERISERPTQGRLEQSVVVSPITGDHRVKHTRSGLEISVLGGLKPGLVYRVRVQNTIKDLFNNPMEGPFELVFSTGGAFEAHVLAGVVTNRISGEPVEQVRVEARQLMASDSGVVVNPDSPTYLAVSDTSGIYVLRYVPSGAYEITYFQDNNRNQEPDFRELKGEQTQTLGLFLPALDTLISDVALLASDTIVAELVRVEAEDSTRLKITFDDFLNPDDPLGAVQVALLVDRGEEEPVEEGPAVERLLWQHQLDSLMAVRDSVRTADSLRLVYDSLKVVRDSLEVALGALQAAGDTVDAPAVERQLEAVRTRLDPPVDEEEAVEEEEPVEPEPILPENFFYALLASPLASDQLYRLRVSEVRNINGLDGGGGESGVTWTRPEPPPGDSAGTVDDSTAVAPDTLGLVPDTLGLVPDSIPPDTGRVVFRGILPLKDGNRWP